MIGISNSNMWISILNYTLYDYNGDNPRQTLLRKRDDKAATVIWNFNERFCRDTWTYQEGSKLKSVEGNCESLVVHSAAHGHIADEATWTGQELADQH